MRDALSSGEPRYRPEHLIVLAPPDAEWAPAFARVSPAGSVFHRLLDRFFGGEADSRTLELIERGTPVDDTRGGNIGPT